ncbi:MAG: bifunctional glutamate N-acetyltransferase/amino-acid acetyltransferase ArgJ [Sandaracinus sp.]|nr:bifunctional glutamate N-acetyltransferase/amino-acid acetyltransferase ArgJ [Sandaracinus sp.]
MASKKKSGLFAPVAGFRFAGLSAGIKKKAGAPDLGLIVADADVPVAAVYTTNRVKAAPVRLAAKRTKRGKARAVVVNAGNANACTGVAGMKAAKTSTAAVASALGVAPESVIPASTGVIGVLLPAEKIVDAAPSLAASASAEGIEDFAHAILTTDRGPKLARVSFEVGGQEATVLAVAKGAGMIHPNMATTLCFVVTDAKVGSKELASALSEASELTFNRISVDGDTSTNDAIVAMASGAMGGRALKGKGLTAFREALREALEGVALQIVADGEGAEHVARITVEGARSDGSALRIARTMATSPLVKTAMHGKDPNWGRLLAAAGRSGERFDPERAEVALGDVTVFRDGLTTMDAETEAKAGEVMKRPRYEITLRLAEGKGRAFYWTCDLGHAYVSCNADYRS